MTAAKNLGPLPHWDLTNVFPSLDSEEFTRSVADLESHLDELEAYVQDYNINADTPAPDDAQILADTLSGYLVLVEKTLVIQSTLNAYVSSFVSTDSFNKTAKRIMSELEILGLRMQKMNILAMGWMQNVAAKPAVLEQALALDTPAKEYAFFVRESVEQSKYQMSESEETLASELSLSGARAWSKLQKTITSQATAPFEVDGETKELPVTMIHNYLSSPDESIRRRSYETETALWKTLEEPIAASLNGIKGAVLTVEKRRGRKDPLHRTLDQARMDRETLETMLGAMKDSFPMFRKYWRKKAQRLGKEALPWWDILAPVGASDTVYTFEEARQFIIKHFKTFSPRLADFVDGTFEKRWIDAEPRPGKSGGAFCMGIASVEESRILCNYDGSFELVGCLAHELGHAYHNYCMKGKKLLLKHSPMTMAETASIFNEQIVFNAAMKQAAAPEEELAILESILIGAALVIVDISSRYLFESEVFERRVQSELSANDFSDIMLRAQQATYGDGLDPQYLNKYMWTWKSHYYIPGLSFYNFPYAFGHLFSLGLYAIYRERGEAFLPEYDQLLASTGEAKPVDLALRFGIDIRTAAFWENSLRIIESHVNRYLEL